MNLFCFSLEGSTDSLYEAVQTPSDAPPPPVPSRSSSRSCSPATLLDDGAKWRGSGRSISTETPRTRGAGSHKKKRRTHVSKSASDNEALDDTGRRRRHPAARHSAKSQEDLVAVADDPSEAEMRRTKPRAETKEGKGAHHPGTRKKERLPSNQSHAGAAATDFKPAVKRGQKPGKKPSAKGGREGPRKTSTAPPTQSPAPPYLDVPCRTDRRSYLDESPALPAQENAVPGSHCPGTALPGGATPTGIHRQRWSNPPGDASSAWGGAAATHTCRRPLTEYRAHPGDGVAPRGEGGREPGAAQDGSLGRERKAQASPKVPRSITDVDLSEPSRSTSFGRFEGLRHQPQFIQEDLRPAGLTGKCESPDPNKSTGVGKKMKAISLTMRRKMFKKHVKSFSEDAEDDADKNPEAETDAGRPAEKKTSANSLESLHSGQSSSSGVTSESNASGGQRDSLKLEEDASYLGQFCGRARVHTDFVPSPYDTDSLKLKVGDVINIISKPPMGIWTGMLNNKVGSFKFIYVDVLAEEKEEEEAPKIRQQKLSKKPRPKTLLELLERLNLEEYASALLLNGYQTVDDLLHLQEKHLIELNVANPEHRRRLLAAAECRYTGDDVSEDEEHKSPRRAQEEDSDCPRDSGCFIPSECPDNKDDAEPLADAVDS